MVKKINKKMFIVITEDVIPSLCEHNDDMEENLKNHIGDLWFLNRDFFKSEDFYNNILEKYKDKILSKEEAKKLGKPILTVFGSPIWGNDWFTVSFNKFVTKMKYGDCM